jgi:hypothetical protein
MNSGTWTTAPVSSVAGLVPPPDAVSPLTPGSVWLTSSSTALGTLTSAGRSSMYRTSTSSEGLIQRSACATPSSGRVICSKVCESMKCASVPSE